MSDYVFPRELYAEDIKRVRNILNMTQKEFAKFVNCSKRTVERWESTDAKITGPIVPLADLLLRDPDLCRRNLLPKHSMRLRLFYLYFSTVCTVIDVDELERRVYIQNYIGNPLYRAFGINTEPTFEDYEEFLKSRCFPETRDKLKLELKKLGLPFYDPILIIEKTDGRMAEDDFWIRIERGRG